MLTRDIGLKSADFTRAENGDLTIELAFSSDAPYERWFGVEILDHDPKSVRLDRLNDGGALLFNHRWDDLRGTHEKGSARVDQDKRGRARVRITDDTQATRDAKAMVNSGVLTKASVGYRIYKVIEQTKAKDGKTIERAIDGRVFEGIVERAASQHPGDVAAFRRDLDAAFGKFERSDDEPTIYRVMDWEPLENSLVTIPADTTVGVNRSGEQPRTDVPPTAQAATVEERKMSESAQSAAAGASAEVKVTAEQAEKERRESALALAKANRVTDPRVLNRWIHDGLTLAEISQEILKAYEERSKTNPTDASAIGLTNRETQRYSVVRALRALRWGANDRQFIEEAAFELEASRAVAQKVGRQGSGLMVPGEVLSRTFSPDQTRAMATTPGSKGGYLVQVENMGFIDILRNRSVALSMGARQLSGLVGNPAFSRQTGKPSVTWQAGEHVNVTAADQTLGQLSMMPRTCIAITDVSEQLLRQSSPSAEAFVMADLAADVAIDGVDASVINGTGGAQPLGIKNTTGITSGQDAATVTYAKLLAFPVAAGAANAIRGNPGWVTNIAGSAILMQKQRFSSTDTPVWEGDLMDGRLVGFRAMSSEQLASGNLIFGSWDEVLIGDWGVLELSTDNGGTRFNTATVGVRAMWMVDVLVRYPQAFVVSTNLAA